MESFPDSKHIFQQAFAVQDPAPHLLEILKTHHYPAVSDLVFYYIEAVENDPYCAQKVASALSRIIKSLDAPSYGQYTFFAVLSRELEGGALQIVRRKYSVRSQ